MYLLYCDDSGSPTDRSQEYFVLGGVAIFERQVHWISRELDLLAEKFNPADPKSVELHGSPMLNGRNEWKQVPFGDRVQAVKDALTILAKSRQSTTAFCVAVKKSAILSTDPVEWAFEELCKQFDHFLKSMYQDSRKRSDVRNHNRASDEPQRGLMIFDETTKETSLQRLAVEFRTVGHSSGILRNLVEVPLFVDSKATRLIQLADLVAWSVFRHVERNDSRFLDVFKDRFHTVSGITHGLLIKHV